MKEEIIKLIQLAQFDAEIEEIREQSIEVPDQIKELEAELTQLFSSVTSKRNEITEIETTKSQKEAEATEHKDFIAKSEAKLKEIKNNKEYHAVIKEIEQRKKSHSQIEDEVLEGLNQIEAINKIIADLETELGEKRVAIEDQIAEKKQILDNIAGQISEKQIVRDDHQKTIDASMTQKYETLKKRIPIAMAEAQDGICLECYTKIPPQFYNELFRYDSLINCPTCQRILYLKPEEN